MQELNEVLTALQVGGAIMVPLSLLAVLAIAVILEKSFLFWRYARLPGALRSLAQAQTVDWTALEQQLALLGPGHYYRRFFDTILTHRKRPLWWTESRAAEQAQQVEQALGRRLWILETVVTAAPLLGLLGTILGMMHAFQLIGGQGLVNPTGVTGGVAQALIATAVGLLIALLALFGFNYLSRLQAHTLDDMERLGTCLLDDIRLHQQAPA